MERYQNKGMQSPSSDENIVCLAKNGDYSAWVTIFSRYFPLVKNRASGYVGTDFESEDLTQEGFIGLIRAVRTYRVDGGSSFKTYAILCIDNSIISAVRKGLSKKRIPGSAIIPLDDCSSLPEETSTEDTYFTKEEFRVLKENFSSKLSSFENQVFSLYIAGYDYDKISSSLGVSNKSVNNAVSRIKRKLRDMG